MASPSRQPPAQAKKGGGWGSLLSGAVAGLESRLDTILADDAEASAKARAAERVKGASVLSQTQSARDSQQSSRDVSRNRGNDRLAERLAKATASKTASGPPSRVGSPALVESARASIDETKVVEPEKSVEDSPQVKSSRGEERDTSTTLQESMTTTAPATLLSSTLPINPARHSTDSSRPSIEVTRSSVTSTRPSSDIPNGILQMPDSDLEAELARLRALESTRQEEMYMYLEKIDALQSKLTYLANSTVAAAKEANASSATSSDVTLAEKDQKIALLMQEGEKLSRTELRHLQTIKKLRTQSAEETRTAAEVKRKLDLAESLEKDLKQKLRKAEVTARQANEKSKQIGDMAKQVEELKADREKAAELIRSLTVQLKEAKAKAIKADEKASEIDKNRIAALENEVEDAQIERKLAEDRAVAEISKKQEEMNSAKQHFSVHEIELKNEIAGLESRFEAMRTRAEEASSDGVGRGEGGIKLMRQVELAQRQYDVAKDNWEAIESSLNARLVALEKERDVCITREAEMRKRARELGLRAKRAEDEVESLNEQSRKWALDLEARSEEVQALTRQREDADRNFEAEKARWEDAIKLRIDEEKIKWQRAAAPENSLPNGRHNSHTNLRSWKGPGPGDIRASDHDLATLQTGQLSPARPSSNRHQSTSRQLFFSPPSGEPVSPTLDRLESSFSAAKTPSVAISDHIQSTNSPDFTLHSASAGPSVQLVERMSAAVRRLEAEKAGTRDELSRLSAQRDEARDEVVSLMRELAKKKEGEEVSRRYEAALEMLGEREEEAEELREQLDEMKRLYRELVERKMGGGTRG